MSRFIEGEDRQFRIEFQRLSIRRVINFDGRCHEPLAFIPNT